MVSSIGVQEFPKAIRVSLNAVGDALLWQAVEDAGGVTAVADLSEYSRSKLYNWRHKQQFYPAAFVRSLLDDEDQYVVAVKGGGRSVPITLHSGGLPLEIEDELLTRIHCSVHVTQEGVPTYQTQDVGNVNRFITLLQQYGDVPLSLYHRSVYELRYPAYLQDIFTAAPYEQDFAALVDEEGRVENRMLIAGDKQVPIEEFSGTLYHRGKKLQLALVRGDSAAITELMASEAEKVQQLMR